MRLKEIKPGMVIHCKNDDEKKVLLKEADRLGYRWSDDAKIQTDNTVPLGSTIHFYDKNEYTDFKCITWSYKTEGVTEFSDLILPELTEDEVWLGIASVEDDEIFEYFQCCGYETRETLIKNAGWKDLVAIVEKHIAANEKKEPEIETVDVCRIIEIQTDGRKRCVHEEDIVSELPFGGDERQIVHNILKRYLAEHEGEFIAVHEVVSRVKR